MALEQNDQNDTRGVRRESYLGIDSCYHFINGADAFELGARFLPKLDGTA